MKRTRKNKAFVMLAALLAAAIVLSVAGAVGAVTPGLYEVEGNPNCANLYQATVISGPASDLLDLGPLFGLKYDNNPTDDVSSTLTDNSPWVVTNGPQDPNNSVSISSVVLSEGEGVQFDWSATLGVDAVIVKAQDTNAYVYSPEEFGDSGLVAPDGKAISHIEFCYDYELDAEKTANAEYTRTYTWDITKEYDGEYWKFIGDPATTHGYQVSVDRTQTDSDFAVSGSITVYNPSPYEVTFSVSDLVDGTEATVTCDDYTLAPNDGAEGGADEETCIYTAGLESKTDGTNTATITSENINVGGAEVTADYAFGDPTTIVGYPNINVTDTNGESWMAGGDVSWMYSRDFACSDNPDDYTDGFYSFTHENTATIAETGQSDDAAVKVNCYAPVPSKDAYTSYTRQYDWTITKDYDGEYWKFIGDPATSHGYKVSVDQIVSEYDFNVYGTITVKNYNPEAAMTVSLEDYVDSTVATLDCDGSLVVPAATESDPGEATCGYSADLDTKTDGTNTATATLNGIGFDATEDYAFGDPTTIVGHPDINVSDTNGGAWTASGDAYWEYTKDFVCPTDTSLYDNGVYVAPDHVNTATIVETGQSDIATVELTCYAPVISKDADGSYDEYHDWTVEKSVDPTGQSAFAGDTVDFDWTVAVDETVTDQNFEVTGQINVYNPAPMAMTVSLSDVLGDGTPATITGCSDTGVTWDGTSLYIPAGVTAICDYTAAPSGGPGLNNFAAALPDQVQFKVQYPYGGGDAYFPTVTIAGGTVLDGTYDGWCVDTDHTIGNNTWYNANVYSSYEDMTGLVYYPENMDKVNWILNQGFVYQPSPGCSGSYTYGDVQRAIWTLVEDNLSTSGLGSWLQCRVNEILAAANANGEGFVPDCNDYIAVVLEPVTGHQVIAVTQVTLIEVGLECPAENTATATLNGIDFSASADIEWSMNVVHGGVTLDDDQNPAWPLYLEDGDTWTYTDPDGYTCSSDTSLYEGDGHYQYTEYNLATIHDGDEWLAEDDATTLVDCYAPVVTKDAAGTYDETHTWDIEKSVDPTSQIGYPGDLLEWTWTVELSESFVDENFDVTGKIYVTNPNPDSAMTISLSDAINGTVADITGCTGGTYSAGSLTVPAGGTATCDYELLDQEYGEVGLAPTSNTATATLNGIDFGKTVDFSWTANVINGMADVDDDQEPDFPLTVNAGGGLWTWKETYNHTCSTSAADYGEDGTYSDTEYNTATVTGSDGQTDSANADTTYTCKAGFFDLLKLTDGVEDPEMAWKFTLSGPGIDPAITVWTPPTYLDFGGPALRPSESPEPNVYTVCEDGIPAGWTSMWVNDVNGNGVFDDGDIVLPYVGARTGNLLEVYDPTFGEENASNETRCVDFTVDVGQTLSFIVDNQFPGGEPRTPGYWKNWSHCSGGGQWDTAQANGGADDGWWTLDEVLPQYLGVEDTWLELPSGDVNDPNYCAEIGQPAINILNKSTLYEGKKKANDAAYDLATHLLAAKLNLSAGACVPTEEELEDAGIEKYDGSGFYTDIDDLIADADWLLGNIDAKKGTVAFDGIGDFLGPKNKSDQRAEAFYLAGLLDAYNNTKVCTGDPTH
jgi:hypothetical protein